jgi:hypothetical protein
MRWVVRLSKIAYTKPITYISAETYSAYSGGFEPRQNR